MEKLDSHFDEWPKLQDSPEYQKRLEEKVKVVQEQQEYSTTLRKANDVLTILDLPDEQDDFLRESLIKLDNKTLDKLAIQSKKDIEIYIEKLLENETKQISIEENKKQAIKEKEKQEESKEQTQIDKETLIESEKNDKYLSQVIWVLTPEILSQFPEIGEKFEAYSESDTKTKKEIIDSITNLLQDNDGEILRDIVSSIGWVNSENYEVFKESLVGMDKSFITYFEDIEKIQSWKAISTSEIIWDIEKWAWGMIDIDLKANPPVSKMSLVWSEYWFSEEIDMNALVELRADLKWELWVFDNAYNVLNNFDKWFNTLLNNISTLWDKENFKPELRKFVNEFSNEIFTQLDDIYRTMDIPSNMQIDEFNIDSLKNVSSLVELNAMIDTIKTKNEVAKAYIDSKQEKLLSEYKWDIKEVLKRDPEQKEKELEVLNFMNSCWFDKFPKELTDKFINEMQSGSLIIPWLDLSADNIDPKNWHFGESLVFNSEWLNHEAKTNMVKFVNKMISWDINWPLPVEAIVNWVSVIDPLVFNNELTEAWLVDGMWWKYSKISENLRNNKSPM